MDRVGLVAIERGIIHLVINELRLAEFVVLRLIVLHLLVLWLLANI